jgi:hypothetical protein
MENKFVVDYDNKVLTLHYQDQIFMFDLNAGDVADFWHGFQLKDGTELDVNFHQEDADDVPFCEIWGTDSTKPLNMQQIDGLSKFEILGNPINYFESEPMEILDATPKGTFYINELSCELADLFIKQTYEYTTETIWEDDGDGGSRYTEFMQEQFDIIHDKIESLLLKNQLKK